MPPNAASNNGEASLRCLGSPKLNTNLFDTGTRHTIDCHLWWALKTPSYGTPLITDFMNSECWPLRVGEPTTLCLLDHGYVEFFLLLYFQR